MTNVLPLAADRRPLEGLRVVSVAEQYPGPFAALLLSDLGADVIQVERPNGGDPSRAYPPFYDALNRGKRSVALDLKETSARAACRALISTADVFLEGYRPGVAERLGLGAPDLLAEHPHLVYVSLSGFGQTGPLRDHPAHDLSFQALAGLLASDGAPTVPLLSLADITAGMFGTIAALTGLNSARSTGRGGHYDVAMFDSLLAVAAPILAPRANGHNDIGLGSDPGYGLFATGDGTWVSVSIAFEDHFWRDLCLAIDLPQFADITAVDRAERSEELRSALAQRFAEQPAEYWDQILMRANVPYGRVNSVSDVVDSPQGVARSMFTAMAHDRGGNIQVRQPLVVDGVGLGPRSGTPELGEHTESVLASLDISADHKAQIISRLHPTS